MLPRRRFVTSTSAAIAAPLAATLFSTGNAQAATAASTDELLRQMRARLTAQFGDARTAAVLAPHILDFALSWQAPTAPIASLNRIVAYAFGNRPNRASGNTPTDGARQGALPDPGPVNEQLADTVAKVYAQNPVPVYAQWEIAHFLKAKHGITPVVSIDPITNPDGSITYLSTDGVAAQVVKLEQNNAAAMGTVGVIGFRDHLKRCVLTSRSRGMQAFAPAGIAMPGDYDPESGQAWTRRRDLYLVHDMSAQLAALRSQLIAAAYPNG